MWIFGLKGGAVTSISEICNTLEISDLYRSSHQTYYKLFQNSKVRPCRINTGALLWKMIIFHCWNWRRSGLFRVCRTSHWDFKIVSNNQRQSNFFLSFRQSINFGRLILGDNLSPYVDEDNSFIFMTKISGEKLACSSQMKRKQPFPTNSSYCRSRVYLLLRNY